jgi:hypothetical protein
MKIARESIATIQLIENGSFEFMVALTDTFFTQDQLMKNIGET